MGEGAGFGRIGWIDITVDDAEGLRDFYARVTGWQPGDVSMGDYNDFTMHPTAGGDPVSGICHARGGNADLPPQWLIYITVADIEASAAACREGGGKVIVGPKPLAGGEFCVIEDPAGAVAALFQPPAAADEA